MFDAKCKHCDTGYDLSYDERYVVSLEQLSPLSDKGIACDFYGWNGDDLKKHSFFHIVGSIFSRFSGKRLFTLVGEVGGKKIDLGYLWNMAGKKSFELSLKEVFPKRHVSGRLIVYVNDVHGFYTNNQGSYNLSIQCIFSE